MSLVAGALLVFFAAGLRRILDEVEHDGILGMTAFGGGLLAVAAGLGAETLNMAGALRAENGRLSAELGRALFEISYMLGFDAAGVGVGILVVAAAAEALRSRRLLPRSLALAMIPFGLAFFTPLCRVLLLPALLLLLVASARLARTSIQPARRIA